MFPASPKENFSLMCRLSLHSSASLWRNELTKGLICCKSNIYHQHNFRKETCIVTVIKPEDLPPLNAFPKETQQVVMDILFCAYQRMLQAEREEVKQPAPSESDGVKPGDYPLVLRMSEVAEILRVNVHKAYDLTRRHDFPCIRDGNRIIVPRDAFFAWLNTAAAGENSSR